MTPNETLRYVFDKTEISVAQLSRTMGFNSPSALWNMLERKVSADSLIEMLNWLGYEVVVQPITSGKRKDGSIVLEPSQKSDRRGGNQRKAKSEDSTK